MRINWLGGSQRNVMHKISCTDALLFARFHVVSFLHCNIYTTHRIANPHEKFDLDEMFYWSTHLVSSPLIRADTIRPRDICLTFRGFAGRALQSSQRKFSSQRHLVFA